MKQSWMCLIGATALAFVGIGCSGRSGRDFVGNGGDGGDGNGDVSGGTSSQGGTATAGEGAGAKKSGKGGRGGESGNGEGGSVTGTSSIGGSAGTAPNGNGGTDGGRGTDDGSGGNDGGQGSDDGLGGDDGGPTPSGCSSPIGTYDACTGTCGCGDVVQRPAIGADMAINECGSSTPARIDGRVVTAWNETGTLSADGTRLVWMDGAVWVRTCDPR